MALSISFALIVALLFEFDTLISKVLLEGISPFQLAGMLYLGAGLVLLPKVIAERGLKADNIISDWISIPTNISTKTQRGHSSSPTHV